MFFGDIGIFEKHRIASHRIVIDEARVHRAVVSDEKKSGTARADVLRGKSAALGAEDGIAQIGRKSRIGKAYFPSVFAQKVYGRNAHRSPIVFVAEAVGIPFDARSSRTGRPAPLVRDEVVLHELIFFRPAETVRPHEFFIDAVRRDRADEHLFFIVESEQHIVVGSDFDDLFRYVEAFASRDALFFRKGETRPLKERPVFGTRFFYHDLSVRKAKLPAARKSLSECGDENVLGKVSVYIAFRNYPSFYGRRIGRRSAFGHVCSDYFFVV